MKVFLVLSAFILISVSAFAYNDNANKVNFEKECAAMISKGGPCENVKKGGGGRRGCVAKKENLAKATPGCKAVIKEYVANKK